MRAKWIWVAVNFAIGGPVLGGSDENSVDRVDGVRSSDNGRSSAGHRLRTTARKTLGTYCLGDGSRIASVVLRSKRICLW